MITLQRVLHFSKKGNGDDKRHYYALTTGGPLNGWATMQGEVVWGNEYRSI